MHIFQNVQNNREIQDYRHEFKYLSTDQALLLLEHRLQGLMALDAHLTDSHYEIRSIYFDDIYKTCYRQNEAGTDPRSKYRIRAYNHDDGLISLEKKSKKNGMTRKESARLTRQQYEQIMAGDYQTLLWEYTAKENRTKQEELILSFVTLACTRHFRPEVIVCYERTPYVEKQGNVRITFDRNISSSVDFAHFFDKDLQRLPVLTAGRELMEVKYDEFLPAYLKEALACGNLSQTTFSKYYICRQERIRR